MTRPLPSPEVQDFLDKLEHVKGSGDGWAAACPCRSDDSNPSLSINQGTDGRVLVTCHRGVPCDINQICTSMGITTADLYPKETRKKKVAEEKEVLTLVATYDYFDEDGTLLFQKLRYVNQSGKKTFRQRRPDGHGGWSWGLGDTPKVLYNLPAVRRAVHDGTKVYVVEGEKDADAMIALGRVATTMPGGAGTNKWLDIHTQALAGAKVEVIADNDEVGIFHAWQVVDSLTAAGCSVRAWRTPRGKDIAEFLGLGGELSEMVSLERPADMAPVVAEEAPEDKMGELADQIANVLMRSDLSESQKLSRASMLIGSVDRPAVLPSGRLVNWQEFVGEDDDDSYDWVIPGLIERQERVIVVASEGVGKTMLARQIAICSAAGLHPFKFTRMPAITTLTIDLENPERIIRRTSRNIMMNAQKYGFVQNIKAHLVIQPSGLDLLKAADRTFIEQQIEAVKPDLICMGPLYKSFIDPGGRTSEAIAVEVAKYLDMIRDVYNCALWLEHHAPLGSSMASRDLRPFGSAVWSRWPEFGLSLQPDPLAIDGYVYEVKHFRGERDLREFPTKMKRGTTFPFEVLNFREVPEWRPKKAYQESFSQSET